MVNALFAACLAIPVTFAAGRPVLANLRRRKMSKSHAEPVTYEVRAGTPVGGIMLLIGGFLASLIFGMRTDENILIPVVGIFVAAVLGIRDDLQGLASKAAAMGAGRRA